MAKKGKGFFGALGSALGSIPVVGKVKKAAKKKLKKAKKKLKKALKKAKKKLKKKLGKVLTKARKLKNNLSKSKLVKRFKKAVKKAVKKAKKYVKKVVKTVKKAVKTVVKAVKKAAKTTVKAVKTAAKTTVKAVKTAAKTTANAAKSAAKTTANVAKSAAKTTVNVAKSATKKAAVAVKSVSISQTISTVVDFIPVVGNAKAVFETAFGYDPFTKEKLSAVDRGITAAGILGGGYAKAAGKGGKTALNFFSNSKNATNATESAAKSSKNAASAKSDVPKGTGNNSKPVSGTKTDFGAENPVSGQDWNNYYKNKYGNGNVQWKPASFDDIIANPERLYGNSKSEIKSILGPDWNEGIYGRNGSGWKFTNPDGSVFYHGGGGVHKGSYYGFSNGKTKKVKVYKKEDGYVPTIDDKGTTIQID